MISIQIVSSLVTSSPQGMDGMVGELSNIGACTKKKTRESLTGFLIDVNDLKIAISDGLIHLRHSKSVECYGFYSKWLLPGSTMRTICPKSLGPLCSSLTSMVQDSASLCDSRFQVFHHLLLVLPFFLPEPGKCVHMYIYIYM